MTELFIIVMFNYSISEYNVLQPPPLNEKVLKDKRKKLKETLERVMTMYVSMTEFWICIHLMQVVNTCPLVPDTEGTKTVLINNVFSCELFEHS
jgi:hypothetical protein